MRSGQGECNKEILMGITIDDCFRICKEENLAMKYMKEIGKKIKNQARDLTNIKTEAFIMVNGKII